MGCGSSRRSQRPEQKSFVVVPFDTIGNTMLKIISLKIPEDLADRLSRVADSRRISRSRLIRELIVGGLGVDNDTGSLSAYDLMQTGLGVISSGHRDLATDPQHLEGFGE